MTALEKAIEAVQDTAYGQDLTNDQARVVACAVLMAVRDPTPKMIEIGCYAPHTHYEPPEPQDVWIDMIDAILNEGQP